MLERTSLHKGPVLHLLRFALVERNTKIDSEKNWEGRLTNTGNSQLLKGGHTKEGPTLMLTATSVYLHSQAFSFCQHA